MFNSSGMRARLGAGVIAATVAAGLSLPSASLSTAYAQAAAAPTCKTPEVIAKLKELRQRIRRYEKRVNDQEVEVDHAEDKYKEAVKLLSDFDANWDPKVHYRFGDHETFVREVS